MAKNNRVGAPVRYYQARNVVFMAPTPVVDALDEIAHELRTSRGQAILYLLDRGAKASKHVDREWWAQVVAASRHTDNRAGADDKPSGKARTLTDLD